jgi:hypothetical protein
MKTHTTRTEKETVDSRKKEPCGCRGCPKAVDTVIVWRITGDPTRTFIAAAACDMHLSELRQRGPASNGPGGYVGRPFADPHIRIERVEYAAAE